MARNEVEIFFGNLEQRHNAEAQQLALTGIEALGRGDLDESDRVDQQVAGEKGKMRFLRVFAKEVLTHLQEHRIKILEIEETPEVETPPALPAEVTPVPVVVPEVVIPPTTPQIFTAPDGHEFGGKLGRTLAFLADEEGGWIPKRRNTTTKFVYGVIGEETDKKLSNLIRYYQKPNSEVLRHGIKIESHIVPPEVRVKGGKSFDWISVEVSPQLQAAEMDPVTNGKNGSLTKRDSKELVDPEVIARAKMGDHAAFEIIFACYWNPIYNFVCRMVGNPEDALDFTQETFMKTYSALPRTSHDLRVGAWIYRIATNTCLDELRHRRLIQWQSLDTQSDDPLSIASVDRATNPAAAFLDKEDYEEVQAILDRLHPKYRACLILYHYQDFSYDEIAEALGTTRASVKALLFRAREEFRQVYARADRKPALSAA